MSQNVETFDVEKQTKNVIMASITRKTLYILLEEKYKIVKNSF